MKALSIRQPWAWLIATGRKDIENRIWKTNYRGKFLIHAGKSFDWNFFYWVEDNKFNNNAVMAANAVVTHFGIEFGISRNASKITKAKDEFGAIIGQAELVYCFKNCKSIWAENEFWHWKISNPVTVAPIPHKGQLGLFEVENE